jgi:hypothetical protein
MFVRGKEKTSLAAQIALIGYIINGTANIQRRYLPVTLMPCVIQQGTYGFHKLSHTMC